VSVDTVQKTAKAYAERGGDVEATISRKKRLTPPVEPKVTGEVEARLIALACSQPPEGRARWSLRLLEKHVVLTDGLPRLDHSTIGRILKKNELRPHLKKCWTIPPTANGEFVARMEDVLDVYARPRNPEVPVLCIRREALPAVGPCPRTDPRDAGQDRKEDSEYVRCGTCSIFVWVEPLAGRRRVVARRQRTRIDWAHEVDQLLTLHPTPNASCWSWTTSTPTPSDPSTRRLNRPRPGRSRSVWRSTTRPKHGSWPNIAEIELSALTRQCLDRRINDIDLLNSELTAWQDAVNADQRQVHWHFTTSDARTRLRHLYPAYWKRRSTRWLVSNGVV
jgi:hypothetical protein